MRVLTSSKDLSELASDLACCFAHENDDEPRGVREAGLRRELGEQMRAEKFRGQPGDRLVWNANGRYGSRRFLVLGLGPEGGPPGESLRAGCARAARAATGFSAKTLGLRLPATRGQDLAAEARAAAEGARLGAYSFDRYLTDPSRRQTRLEAIEIASDASPARLLKSAVALGDVGARAVALARDLVNEAPSRLTPRIFAQRAAAAARTAGVRCRVLDAAQIRKLGLHALLAVARGSDEPPRVVHLTYVPRGRRKSKERILLVGKGVTFDSGGLDLKTAEGMLTMKMDMAGAAAVLATLTALDAVGCSVEVHALLGLVENMTGGSAYKPGDILDTRSGKTVEVGNTDAEGRLVLCDLLAYGSETLKPSRMVDVATLTGACVVALGTRIVGLFTRHGELRDALLAAGRTAGETLWQLPMHDEYLQLLQRGPADLRNVGGRWGGAITAALFLGEFVPRSLPWAHLDIAGPAFTDNDLPESPIGGTGVGVLTLLRWLERA